MQRIRQAVGDQEYPNLIRISFEVNLATAYEFNDSTFFRESIITLRNEIQNKLLGKGVNNNLFEAISDIKTKIGILI